MVSAAEGMVVLWLVALGEGLRGESVGPGCGVWLAVVSSGVAFPKLPPWAVVAFVEAVSVTIVGMDMVMVSPPSCSMGAVGSGDVMEVVLFWGWCVILCLLVPLGELQATAAVEGTRLATVVATEVLV